METLDVTTLIILTFLMFICLIATVAYLLHYVGVFYHVKVSCGKPVIDDVWIAYKSHVGPYNECSSHFTELCSLFPELETIGIFYDDSSIVPADKLRYVVGVVVCKGKEKPSESIASMIRSRNLKLFQLPSIDHAVNAQFPFVFNVCAVLGFKKVYPVLKEYIKYHKVSAHPFLEYYAADKIFYFAPLCKQSDFFVPEVEYGLRTFASEATVKEPSSSINEESEAANTSDEESQDTTSSFEELYADQAASNDNDVVQ